MFHAIKPLYNRKTKSYEVDHREDANLLLVHEGFYVTDSLAATLGRITAGKCSWFDGLAPAKQQAIKQWLVSNI